MENKWGKDGLIDKMFCLIDMKLGQRLKTQNINKTLMDHAGCYQPYFLGDVIYFF